MFWFFDISIDHFSEEFFIECSTEEAELFRTAVEGVGLQIIEQKKLNLMPINTLFLTLDEAIQMIKDPTQ